VAQLLEAWAGTANPQVVLALNKLDRLAPDQITTHSEAYRALAPGADWTALSAVTGSGIDDLLQRVIAKLPPGPQFFPEDQLSDTALRDIAAEIIREKVLLNTEQEVPHSVAVEIEEFKERSATLTYIGASAYIERDSQKGILIGKGGARLKKISTEARTELEALIGTQVYLELRVKVLRNWRRDEEALRRLGYRIRK
jgi:GTP-binding protein Era